MKRTLLFCLICGWAMRSNYCDAGTFVQTYGYTHSQGDPSPEEIVFQSFDDLDGTRQLTAVELGFEGHLSTEVIVENYDPLEYDTGDWFIDVHHWVMLSFAETDQYVDGGPFFSMGGVAIQGLTGPLSAGTGGNPIEPGMPGEVTVTGSVASDVSAAVQLGPDDLNYFRSDNPLTARVGPFFELLVGGDVDFLSGRVLDVADNGVLSLTYRFDLLGDLNDDGVVNGGDIDELYDNLDSSVEVYDLNGDDRVDETDVDHLVLNLLGTRYGDSNLDGRFGTSDLVTVFRAGEYEDDKTFNSTWIEGDWNGDLEFDSGDFTFVFSRSGEYYEAVTAIAAVPEPIFGKFGLLLTVMALGVTRRSQCKRPL